MPRNIIPQSDILTLKSPPSSHSHNDLDWIYTDNLDNDNHKDLEDKNNKSSAARSAKTEQKKRHVVLPSSNSLEVLEVIFQTLYAIFLNKKEHSNSV